MNITWTASNENNQLIGKRTANTVLAAVRAGRDYIRRELNGEGRVTIYKDGIEIRQDRRDIFTAWKWEITNL